MVKEVLYQYLGTNGIILSPVHLEDVYYIRKLRISADSKKILVKKDGTKTLAIIIPEEELSDWEEKELDEN